MTSLAALLTGALLTIGVCILLVIMLAIKKNREQARPHENGMKEKHIGKRDEMMEMMKLFDAF